MWKHLPVTFSERRQRIKLTRYTKNSPEIDPVKGHGGKDLVSLRDQGDMKVLNAYSLCIVQCY